MKNCKRAYRVLRAILQIAACAGFFGWVGFQIWSANQCRYTQDCAGYQRPANSREYQGWDFSGWEPANAIDRYTLLLAVFTGGLLLVSGWQGIFLLRADKIARTTAAAALTNAQAAMTQAGHLENSVAQAKRAADEMANVAIAMTKLAATTDISSKQQLRAYVFPLIHLRDFTLTGRSKFFAALKIAGPTPVSDLECHGIGFFAALPIGDDASIAEPAEDAVIRRHSKGSFYPGADSDPMADFELVDEWSPEIISELLKAKPKIAIYVAGKVHYRDVFKESRYTEFCVFIHSDDTRALIMSEQNGAPRPDVVRFVHSHVCNNFT